MSTHRRTRNRAEITDEQRAAGHAFGLRMRDAAIKAAEQRGYTKKQQQAVKKAAAHRWDAGDVVDMKRLNDD